MGLYNPPGHYYSPIASKSEMILNQERIFGARGREIPGINLQVEAQLNLVKQFGNFYTDFSEAYAQETAGKTFRPTNGYYSFTDAIFLYCMIRHFRPSNIFEVGSGFSSTLMLDINRDFFNDTISLAFVEPYPEID